MAQVHKLNQVVYDKMVDLYESEKYQSAIDLGKSLLEKAKRLDDKVSEKKALEVLSYASYFLIDYIGAMTYIIQFAKLVEADGEIAERIKTYNVFISLYTRQGEYNEAKKLLIKVNELATENKLHLALCKNENNYGFFHNTFKEYHKSIPHLLNALAISEKHHFNDLIPVVHGNLAVAYIRTGELEHGKESLDTIFTLMAAGHSGISRAEAYMYRGELYAIQGKYEEALKQLQASKVISNKYGYTAELAEATLIEASTYKRQNDYDKAYHALEEYIELNQILSNTAKRGAVTKLKMEYDVNKREIEADILREQNAILEDQNRMISEQRAELERLNEVLGRQNDDLHQSAIEDYLTGVFNRKYFTLKLQEEFSIANEHDRNVACIIFDIDKFKNINDTYGHLVGDEMIKHVSSICEEALDTDSIIGRFGGDEFMILMVDSDIYDAELKANELLDLLANEPLWVGKQPVHATLSLGIADNHHLEPKTTDEMMHIADQGLYLAKESGRNKCCLFTK